MDHLRPFGVRKAKVGADGKRVAYLVSPAAVAVFTFIGALLLGAAVYYSWALEAQVRELKIANGWEESDNLDEETRLAHHFFHSAEILVNILQSEQQTVEDGVIVSEAVLQEIETLKAQVGACVRELLWPRPSFVHHSIAPPGSVVWMARECRSRLDCYRLLTLCCLLAPPPMAPPALSQTRRRASIKFWRWWTSSTPPSPTLCPRTPRPTTFCRRGQSS